MGRQWVKKVGGSASYFRVGIKNRWRSEWVCDGEGGGDAGRSDWVCKGKKNREGM